MPDRFPDPSHAGDGAPDDPQHVEAQRLRKVRALTENETGLRFESLVLFAEPLFELYELDATEAFMIKHDPAAADDSAVLALEAARLFWAYFSLPDAERAEQENTLADFLLGPGHTPDDHADFEMLLDRMADQWSMLTTEDRATAESADTPTLSLSALVAHPAFAHGPSGEATMYGPDGLSEVEARALFAQPLFESLVDVDEMEAAMDRASSYWTMAHAEPSEREAHLSAFVQRAAVTPPERAVLEREGRMMLARFDQLFPEHRV